MIHGMAISGTVVKSLGAALVAGVVSGVVRRFAESITDDAVFASDAGAMAFSAGMLAVSASNLEDEPLASATASIGLVGGAGYLSMRDRIENSILKESGYVQNRTLPPPPVALRQVGVARDGTPIYGT